MTDKVAATDLKEKAIKDALLGPLWPPQWDRPEVGSQQALRKSAAPSARKRDAGRCAAYAEPVEAVR